MAKFYGFSDLISYLMPSHKIIGAIAGLAGLGSSLAFAEAARADLTVCNNTKNTTAYVAFGVNTTGNNWLTEGWWQIKKGTCEVVVSGKLDGYYYIYASDRDETWVWAGESKDLQFCVKPDEDFKLTMTGDLCAGKDTARRKFYELDLRGKTSYTENLED